MECEAKLSRSRGGALRRVGRPSGLAAIPLVSAENALAARGPATLAALAEGLDISAAERVFGIRHATITRWLLRAGTHTQTVHERSDLAICRSRTSNETNCAPGCAATRTSCGSGSPSIHQAKGMVAVRSAHPPHGLPAHPPPARAVGRLSVCPSSPAMASMRISPPSPLTLGNGPRKRRAEGRCGSGRWRQAYSTGKCRSALGDAHWCRSGR
jgi:hypothetical protein